jgi:hypothetical protein
MEGYKWHLIWIGAIAALSVDVFLAVMKKFNIALPGLS